MRSPMDVESDDNVPVHGLNDITVEGTTYNCIQLDNWKFLRETTHNSPIRLARGDHAQTFSPTAFEFTDGGATVSWSSNSQLPTISRWQDWVEPAKHLISRQRSCTPGTLDRTPRPLAADSRHGGAGRGARDARHPGGDESHAAEHLAAQPGSWAFLPEGRVHIGFS